MAEKSRQPTPPPQPAPPAKPVALPSWTSREWTVAALLVALNAVVFGQLASHVFLSYDDGQFIYENEAVRQGLTSASIRWALTSGSIGWYPTTWLSHMTDVSLWGLRPGCHLLVGLALHIGSTLLLFATLHRMTRAPLRSALVAALFAIHPMHVESVAWASERKDTLSTFFAMLALLFYRRHGSERTTRDRVLVGIALALSLMAKQMLVTLPFVLLLLDWWPLDRIERSFRNVLQLITEKIPLFALAVAGCVAAVIGQRNLNAMQSSAVLPLLYRTENALIAYVRYLAKFFWPTNMAVLYPLGEVSPAAAFVAAIFLLAISVFAWHVRESAPYVPVGWLWYLGTLVPVIGLVQVGSQSMADRYTYFSYIGLFIVMVWGIGDLAARLKVSNRVLWACGVAVVAVLASVSWKQTSYWKDSDTLFTHTIAVTGPNLIAEYSLGQTLQRTDPDRAMPHLGNFINMADEAMRRDPHAIDSEWYAQAHVAMGTSLLMKARAASAIAERRRMIDAASYELELALKVNPQTRHARSNFELAGKMRNALPGSAAPHLNEQFNTALNNGTALAHEGRRAEAIAEFRKAVALMPTSTEARIYLALALLQANEVAAGVAELREATRLDPEKANHFLTRALRLPERPTNLREGHQAPAAALRGGSFAVLHRSHPTGRPAVAAASG